MLVCPHVGRVSTLRHNARVGPDSAVCVELVLAVRLVVVLALPALEAGVALRTDADALTLLDQRYLRSYTDRLADDLCYRSRQRPLGSVLVTS